MDLTTLAGKRIAVTRPAAQADEICRRIEALGGVPVRFPTIEIVPPDDPVPVDDAIRNLGQYDWIVFTSVNGVERFAERLGEPGTIPPTNRIAAIGPATADALRTHGWGAHVVPDEYVAERVAEAMGEVSGQRVLLARAAAARKALGELLRAAGAEVDDVAFYATVAARPSPTALDALRTGVDAIAFTSSSTVRYFEELAGFTFEGDRRPVIACIGPITARTAAERGLTVDVVADQYTTDGLLDALGRHFAAEGQNV